MKLTVLLPSLFWPDRHDAEEVLKDLPLPALSRLLGWARIQPKPQPWSRLQASHAGLAAPSFALWAAEAAGLPWQQGGWLLADPVHLRVNRDQAQLADAGVMNLDENEACALAGAVNALLAEDGARLHVLSPARWLLQLPLEPDADFTPLVDAVGEDVNRLLPAGGDGLAFSRLLGEIQMLLYTHPVNDAREARGEVPVNSVWLWGKGEVGEPVFDGVGRLYADDRIGEALAARAGVACEPVPYRFGALWEDTPRPGRVEVHLDRLFSPAHYRDAWGWREALSQLEDDWFAPLLAAFTRGRIETLTLLTDGHSGFAAELVAPDRLKFWRRARPLTQLLCAN